MGSFDPAKYEFEKKKAHDFFQATHEVTSPLLGTIHFNSDGFMHMLFRDEDRREKRDWKDQVRRFQFLPKVPDVIRKMHHCQEYFEVEQHFEIKMNKQRLRKVKVVRYWGFVAIINNYQKRIKVILRQVGQGQIHFWSVIPYWKVRGYKDVTRIDMTAGDLSRD
jgi:hypothetical protein